MTDEVQVAGRLLAQDVSVEQIEHAPVDAADVCGGRPTMGTVTLSTAAGVEIGVWEITSGVVTDIEADEVFIVLSGRGRVEFADGSDVALGAGTVVRLRAGDRTRWIIYETLRKIYVVLPSDEGPRPDVLTDAGARMNLAH